jgi:hypothetical protein
MGQRITRRTFTKASLSTAAALPFTGHGAWAQAWPSKPIKIVCGLAAGGLADLFARAYGEYLARNLGQAVVVENKPGVGGALAAQAVKASPADGHTLLFAISTTMIMNRVLYRNLPYDPDKDFVLISTMSAGPQVYVAHRSTGATNVREFVEYARRNKMSVGTWGAGSGAHITVTELNRHFGLQMEAVHYKGLPHPLGTAARMGPGYFPTVLGALLAGIGAVLLIKSVVVAAVNGERVGRIEVWLLLRVLLAVAAFGLLLNPLGIVATAVIVVVVASWAGHEFRLGEALINSAVLALLSYALFIRALGQTMPVWPWFLTG